MKESVLCFSCEGEPLVGILTEPDGTVADIGVVIVVGGPQYRAGSHRQFTLTARHLARNGFPVLRFDYRSMGDSGGTQRDFLQVDADIGAAIDALRAQLPGVKQVVLWGLCDGASAALLYCQQFQRADVQGLCLLNPWVRSETSLARTHVKYYYRDRLLQREFWIKLLRGGVSISALTSLWRNLRSVWTAGPERQTVTAQLPFQQRMALGWRGFPGQVLLLLSESDYVAKEFIEFAHTNDVWCGLISAPGVTREIMADADHTFSNSAHRIAVEQSTIQWLRGLATGRTDSCGSAIQPPARTSR